MKIVKFKDLDIGYYPVLNDETWEVMFWDGTDFYDTASGDYSSYDNKQSIAAVGERILLPPKVQFECKE